MRKLILAFSLFSLACTSSFDPSELNVVVQKVEFIETSSRYHLREGAFKAIEELLKNGVQELKNATQTRGIVVLNEYGDQIVTNFRNLLIQKIGWSPLEIPDIHESFSYSLIITYHGELDLTNGFLSDFWTFRRGGNFVVFYSTSSGNLKVTVPIAFADLRFTYDYSASLMGLGPSGTVQGQISDIAVEATITLDTKNYVFSLDGFSITHTGALSLSFHGTALIDWLLDLLGFVASYPIKEVILVTAEEVIREGLETTIDTINHVIHEVLNGTSLLNK